MGGHDIPFAIVVEIADSSKPWLARPQWKLA
jgi:hypothetical protein